MPQLTYQTAGESHGPGLYTFVDGLPAGVPVDTDFIDAFLRQAADAAEAAGGVIAVEHLRAAECNTLNTVAEAAEYVRRADRPGVKLLVDSYHLWAQGEDVAAVEAAGDLICHVHVADHETRNCPGQSDQSAALRDDYRRFFAALQAAGYDGRISVEGHVDHDPAALAAAHDYLRDCWETA